MTVYLCRLTYRKKIKIKERNHRMDLEFGNYYNLRKKIYYNLRKKIHESRYFGTWRKKQTVCFFTLENKLFSSDTNLVLECQRIEKVNFFSFIDAFSDCSYEFLRASFGIKCTSAMQKIYQKYGPRKRDLWFGYGLFRSEIVLTEFYGRDTKNKITLRYTTQHLSCKHDEEYRGISETLVWV